MFVDFESVRFKNVLSYGNRWTTIDFHKGLNLIKAQNGSGKSTILDAINYCLFGKPFRDIKINQLINKYNGKEMIVEVKFRIANDHYTIIRGQKPAVFSIIKNGNEIDNLSTKRLNQEEIEKLLGINERLFKNIVGIAVTNNKPFLTMSIGDKRSLIESIFNIDVLSAMARKVKNRNTFDKSEQRLKLTELGSIQTQKNDNQAYIDKIRAYVEKFDENKARSINEIEGNIKQYEDVIKKQKEIIAQGEKMAEAVVAPVPPTVEEMNKLNKEIGAAEHNHLTDKKTLAAIGTGATCPLCGSVLDEGHAKEHIISLKAEVAELENVKLPELYVEQKRLMELKADADAAAEKINTINRKLLQVRVELKANEDQVDGLQKQLDNINAKTCDLSTDEYVEKMKDIEARLKVASDEIDEINHRIEIDNKLVEILGDEGLRMFFFAKLLPVLNNRIAYYLNKFELQASVEFNAYMNETIKTGRFEQSYNQFSGGEKSRIDMSILLSFFDISKMISNWSCSILFIDEVMDSGVDGNGISQFLSTLYNIVTENDKNIGIYLISHKLSDVDIAWDEVIEIEKKSMFSELKRGK